MYLTPTERHFACDIEADDLYDGVTQIWCSTLLNVVTKERFSFLNKEEFYAFQERHPDIVYVGHNFLAYDAPVLNRLWGTRIGLSKVVDTFVLSQLYNPSYPGGHSLEAWGKRLKYPKGEWSDFSKFSPEMLKYCSRDTALTAFLFLKLTERMRQVGFSEQGCELEHRAWHIIQNKQKRNGFPFDQKKAHELYVTLRAREEELEHDIYRLWPPELRCVATRSSAFKKNGEHTAKYVEDSGRFPKLEIKPDGSYDVFDYVKFNLGSPAQRIERLLGLGWKPVEKTKTGNPKVDEDSLLAYAELSGTPEVSALAKWVVVNSRANMVGTWLNAYNEKTGAIHGSLFLASTLRYRHSGPNSANIPSVRKDKEDTPLFGEAGAWTYECRDLWTSGGDEWTLVGIDGKGMQLRCLAHNVAKIVGSEADAFIESVLTGDPHKRNIEILGLPNKPAAKKFLYTTLMGGGGAKLAVDQAQFGLILTSKDGDRLKKLLIDSVPGFGRLIAKLQAELQKTGRITLCDDTPILVPSPHMVIPYILQGDESRLMKRALWYVDTLVRAHGWSKHVLKVADIHDEWQYRVRNEYVRQFVEMALPCFNRAGESFDYRIRIDGDAAIGKTWAQTH